MLEQLNNDIKEAMKSKNKEKLLALRYLKSMIMENNTSKKPVPEMDVAIKHHKKLKDSLTSYPAGHPTIEKTNIELEFIASYLPVQMSEIEVSKIIEEIKNKFEDINMGMMMKELQPQIKGKFDGRKASEMVKKALS